MPLEKRLFLGLTGVLCFVIGYTFLATVDNAKWSTLGPSTFSSEPHSLPFHSPLPLTSAFSGSTITTARLFNEQKASSRQLQDFSPSSLPPPTFSSHFCSSEIHESFYGGVTEGSFRRHCVLHNVCLLSKNTIESNAPLGFVLQYFVKDKPEQSFGSQSKSQKLDYDLPKGYANTDYPRAPWLRKPKRHPNGEPPYYYIKLETGKPPEQSSELVEWNAGTNVFFNFRHERNHGHVFTQALLPVFDLLSKTGDVFSNVTLWSTKLGMPRRNRIGLLNRELMSTLMSDHPVREVDELQAGKQYCFKSFSTGLSSLDFLGLPSTTLLRNTYPHGRGMRVQSFRNFIWKRLHLIPPPPLLPSNPSSPCQIDPTRTSSSSSWLPPLNIIVNLKQYGNRKVSNFEQVRDWITNNYHGQEIVKDGRTFRVSVKFLNLQYGQSMKEQLTNFHHAHVYLTTPGSGMYYAMFMPDNSAVLHFPACSCIGPKWKPQQDCSNVIGWPGPSHHIENRVLQGPMYTTREGTRVSTFSWCFFHEWLGQVMPHSYFRSYPIGQVSDDADVIVERATLISFIDNAILHVSRAAAVTAASSTVMREQPLDSSSSNFTSPTPTATFAPASTTTCAAKPLAALDQHSSHHCVEEFNAGYRMCRFTNLCMDVSATSSTKKKIDFFYFASQKYEERLSTQWTFEKHDARNISDPELEGFVDLVPRGAVSPEHAPDRERRAGEEDIIINNTDEEVDFLLRERRLRHRLSPRWIASTLPSQTTGDDTSSSSSTSSSSRSVTWLDGTWIVNDVFQQGAALRQGEGAHARLREFLHPPTPPTTPTTPPTGDPTKAKGKKNLDLDWLFYQGDMISDTFLPVFELLQNFDLLRRYTPLRQQLNASMSEDRLLTVEEINQQLKFRPVHLLTLSEPPPSTSSSSANMATPWSALLSTSLQYAQDMSPGRYCFRDILAGTGMRGYSGKLVAKELEFVNSIPHNDTFGNFPSVVERGFLVKDFRNSVHMRLVSQGSLALHPVVYRRLSFQAGRLTLLVNLDGEVVADATAMLASISNYYNNKQVHGFNVDVRIWGASSSSVEEDSSSSSSLAADLASLSNAHVFLTTPGTDAYYSMFLPDYSSLVYLPSCMRKQDLYDLYGGDDWKTRKSNKAPYTLFNFNEQKIEVEASADDPQSENGVCFHWETRFLSELPYLHVRVYGPDKLLKSTTQPGALKIALQGELLFEYLNDALMTAAMTAGDRVRQFDREYSIEFDYEHKP